MRRVTAFVIAIPLFLFLSCTRQEETDVPESSVSLSVGSYPSFRETRAAGVIDQGKTTWCGGDVLYLVFQTAESPMAARYRATYDSGSWNHFEKYVDGAYSPAASLTAPAACRALVYYAPSYEFSEKSVLKLSSGKSAGLDEFLQWSSGAKYDINGNVALSVSFVKDYSRLRVVSEKGFSVKVKSSDFIPAGYDTAKLGTGELTAEADTNANAFFYGSWTDGTAFDISTYDKDGELSFSDSYPKRSASVNGTGYVVDCRDTAVYTSIADLVAGATSYGSKFNVQMKKAVVTYVLGRYAHLEDESGAVLIYVKDHGLTEGQSITGEVSGTIELYRKMPEITSIDYSKARISTVSELPCTLMTISDLLDDFNANLSRRILLKNITIDRGIKAGSTSKRSGIISQNGSSIAIYGTYSANPAVLETGLSGDLIAFPCRYDSNERLSVYESSQFSEGGGEDTPFTRLTLAGFYSDTGTESPSPLMVYAECEDQYSFGSGSGKSFYHLFNIESGKYGILDMGVSSYKIGDEFDVAANLNGVVENHSVTVVAKNSNLVWLEDKTNGVGYIIALK